MRKSIQVQLAFRVALTYALAVVLMTLPASLYLSQRLIGNNIDNWIFYWNNWWLERAITEGRNWFFTPYIFFPHGASLVAHSNSYINCILAFALKPVVGPVAAYNLTFLSGLWLSAVGMFLLVYELTHHRLAAFLAGFIFAFAPYHLTEALAHAHLGSIHWWPFYALFLHRALRGHRTRDALCAGLFAALTFWSGLHLALLLALWTLAYLAWQLGAGRHLWLRPIGAIGITALTALLLSLPILIPVIGNWDEVIHAPTPLIEQATRQTDLLAYFIPPTYNSFIGPYVVPLYERFIVNRAIMPYSGFATLALVLIALFKQPKSALFWGLSGGLWILLAAGPTLRINGTLYPDVPLPYRIVGRIFPISTVREPDRFNLLVTFSLSVLAGVGAAWTCRQRRWLIFLVVALLLLEYSCIPLPMWNLPPASPFFGQMAHDKTKYGVVDYPMDYELAKLFLYYQTLHSHPVVQGHVSRYTAENYAFIYSQPLLRALYEKAARPPYLPLDEETYRSTDADTHVQALGPALRSLNSTGVRYVLLHKPYLNATLWAHFKHILPLTPVYEDSTLAVYDFTRPLPFYYGGFPIPLTRDVALAQLNVQHNSTATEWQFQILALLLAPRPSPLACQIQLIGENTTVRTMLVTLFEPLPTGETWQTGDLELKEITTLIAEELEPDLYRWTINCAGQATYTIPETLTVRDRRHITYLRRLGNITYGENIQFLGYRWQTAGANLEIELAWEALKRLDADYKVFVHLLNAAGEIVRQYDAMPCNWQCPTSQWQANKPVSDQAVIALWGLPPGKYRLAVGLYDARTQDRLVPRGPEGEQYPNDYLILPDIFLVSTGHL